MKYRFLELCRIMDRLVHLIEKYPNNKKIQNYFETVVKKIEEFEIELNK